MRITVRDQAPGDEARVAEINRVAFPKTGGAKAFYAIRESGRPDIISLVAEVDEYIVGHILYTPVDIDRPGGGPTAMGLAELAVDPDYQRKGVGRSLHEAGIQRLSAWDCVYIIVVGVPEYYPRLGFQRGSAYGLKCQWDGIPDEAFMVLVLDPERLRNVSGVAAYTDAF